MSFVKSVFAGVVLIRASSVLVAQEEKMGKCKPSFDGSLPNTFAAADADGDGVASKEEIAKFVAGGQLDNLFARWDKDENGTLSREEYCMR